MTSEKYWYHGTPDVRELEKEGGFSDRVMHIEAETQSQQLEWYLIQVI